MADDDCNISSVPDSVPDSVIEPSELQDVEATMERLFTLLTNNEGEEGWINISALTPALRGVVNAELVLLKEQLIASGLVIAMEVNQFYGVVAP